MGGPALHLLRVGVLAGALPVAPGAQCPDSDMSSRLPFIALIRGVLLGKAALAPLPRLLFPTTMSSQWLRRAPASMM